MMSGRIYLDNAATSFPKPVAVYEAVDRYQRESGAAFGRGNSAEASQVRQVIERCRRNLARLIGAREAARIVFTFNGTDSLNLALSGLLRSGDHVVCSTWEHNSVLRPLHALIEQRQIEVDWVPLGCGGLLDPDRFWQAVRPTTRLVCLTHASNVTGQIQPIEEIGRRARAQGVRFLVDAAQTVGAVEIDVEQMGIDLLAAPGHKGLLGPLGTGMLYLAPGLEREVMSFRQGGTGSFSEEERQPEVLPDKYEAGNLNVPGLIGLEAGSGWVLEQTVAALQQREHILAERLAGGLRELPGVKLHGWTDPSRQAGIVSFEIAGSDPRDVGLILEQSFGVICRTGLHCAPGVHRELGTMENGGSVRFSVGPMVTEGEIDAAVEAVRQIAEAG